MSATTPQDGLLRQLARLLWRLVVATVDSCMRYRVTGLAAEAAFFAVLSLPPLVFGLAGAIGFASTWFSPAQIADIKDAIIDLSSRALTDAAVDRIITPTVNTVLEDPRYDVISIGFILALWSGSRALNVFVDTITIMHGLGGRRGIVKTRALSFALYVLFLITGVVAIPLVVAGPGLVDDWLPQRVDILNGLYWPTVVVLCICTLATLYHVSIPERTLWRYNLPGAVFAMAAWVVGSWLLRAVLTATAAESRSVFGPLAAPIAILLWLYIVSIAVLIGAALNTAVDSVWPQNATARTRAQLVRRLRGVLPARIPGSSRSPSDHTEITDRSTPRSADARDDV